MTPQIGPFHVDIWMNILPHLQITEYPTLTRVCQPLNELLTEKFWKPSFEIKFPINVQQQKSEDIPYNMRVAILFQKNGEEIDFIVDQIKDDAELAKCLHSNDWTLKIFKELSSFDRSRLMWKAMFQDATPVLEKLVSGLYTNSLEARDAARQDDHSVVMKNFIKADNFSPIVKLLIEKHKVPYDKVDFICALLLVIRVSSIAKQCIVNIIDSGEDLSKLKNKTIQDPETGILFCVYNSVINLYTNSAGNDWKMMRANLMRCRLRDW
jgi:hypothetical protein